MTHEPTRASYAMGCLLVALILIGMYLIGTPARSQEAPAAPPCLPHETMLEKLEVQFGETVTAGGVVGPFALMYLTENPVSHSFTILIRNPRGQTCIVMGGEGFALANPAKRKGPGL